MASDVRASAFLLIFLISGGECFRVNQQSRAFSIDFGLDSARNSSPFNVPMGGEGLVETGGVVGAMANTFSATPTNDWWPSWWGAGHEACRDDADTRSWSEWWNSNNASLDGQQTLERYDYKLLKLQILITSIKRDNCTASCFASWKQAQERLRQLESCMDLMRPDAIGSPPEFSNQEIKESTAVKFSKLGRDVIHVMKGHGYLKPTEKCGFYFENLNVGNAMARNETHAASEFTGRMFGEECDADSQADWFNQLPPSQAEFVRALEEEFKKQADSLEKGTLPEEVHLENHIKRIIESGRADPTDYTDSLVQVAQGTDLSFGLVSLILAIVFGILVFCLMMFVLYMFVVVSMFSAVGSSTRTRDRDATTSGSGDRDDDVPVRLPESGHVIDRGVQPVEDASSSDSGGGIGGRQYTVDSLPRSKAYAFDGLALGFCVVGQAVLM